MSSEGAALNVEMIQNEKNNYILAKMRLESKVNMNLKFIPVD